MLDQLGPDFALKSTLLLRLSAAIYHRLEEMAIVRLSA